MPTHITLGRSVGLTEQQLGALASPESADASLPPLERVVVRYARRLTRLEPIDDELFTELGEHFSLRQIVELCMTVGISNVVNRFHATFHTPLDSHTAEELSSGTPLPLPEQPS